tara:strand:+ start:5273 stop:5479 length:207 start_codon:yes stop_codon:yes gene_type:complete
MKCDIFYPLFRNIIRLKKLPVNRYNWNIEMKILELNCEIDTFISQVNKKIENDKKLTYNLTKSNDISK